MHRASALDNPLAPITHHWLDSLSGRLTFNPSENWSLQVSVAQINSPEQLYEDIDVRRVTASAMYNRPVRDGNWQTTLAWGRNKRESVPLPPEVTNVPTNVPGFHFHTGTGGTGAQGALLLESTLTKWRNHTFYGRWAYAQKDELFLPIDTRHATVYDVSRFSLGYIFDLPLPGEARFGLGLAAAVTSVPAEIEEEYGSSPSSFTGFLRVRLGR